VSGQAARHRRRGLQPCLPQTGGPPRSSWTSFAKARRRPGALQDVPSRHFLCESAGMAKHPYTIIRGGKLLDTAKRAATSADSLAKGHAIAERGRRGLAAPAGAAVIDARNRLMHPGLINAHTHGPGNLGKGMGDLWSLELLLTASQWLNGG